VYVGKRSARIMLKQGDIKRLLVEAARQGKQVVRLKGGDPMVFGHAGEEIEYLQSCMIGVSVIPGITRRRPWQPTRR
jgi:siroheme synthase